MQLQSDPNSKNQTTGEKPALVDRPRGMTIQIKLMAVLSGLFVITVSLIIFLASFFFRKDNIAQIEANNLRNVRVTGLKVKTDINGIIDKASQMILLLENEANQQKYIDLFFRNDKDFLFLGSFSKNGENLKKEKAIYNKTYLNDLQLKEDDLNNVIQLNKNIFLKTFEVEQVLYNASSGSKEPIFALSFKIGEGKDKSNIIIALLKLEKIASAFEKSGITTTYLVDGDGLLIAHPNKQLLFSSVNMSDVDIVKEMLTKPVTNGKKTYVDKDGKTQIGSFQKIDFAGSGIISTVEEDQALEGVYNIQRRNIYIMIISLCFALMIVYLFAKTISRPILSLLYATVEIARGNFKINVTPTTRDEVGLLTEYFKNMGEGLEEREKVKSILGSMIDPVVVKEAMKDMAALKRGSQKEITAYFSDVAGFSTISEQLNSIDLASLLNEYLSAMTIILKKYDGVLDKYIGDAIVGIFNAPVDVPNHEIAAARASVEMIQKLRDLREYWTKNNLYSKEAQEMDARIGLNSGLAKVGFMGTDALASYTMMGDTVNLAARLEAAGKDYGVNILISESVNDKVEHEMFTRGIDLVRVKGKNEPVKLFELICLRSDASSNLIESAEIYKEAFDFYLEQQWDKAIAKFELAGKAKGKKDKAIDLLMDRCSYYKISPPGNNWDGVFTRKHK